MSVNAVSSNKVRSSRVRRLSRPATAESVPWLRDQHLLQRLELLDALAGAHCDRVERVVGDENRHAGLMFQPLVQAAQQRTTPGEHDAAIHDVAGALRRALVECCL